MTEDPDLVKAREAADAICRWTRPQLRRQVIAALLRARADGIMQYGETGPCSCHEAFSSRKLRDPECAYHDHGKEAAEDAARLRALADQEESK